jgi:hypothetical protein
VRTLGHTAQDIAVSNTEGLEWAVF